MSKTNRNGTEGMPQRDKPEAKVQIAIIRWLRTVMPNAMIHHSVNEGNRGGRQGMLDGARKKNMGMMPGFPDLIIITQKHAQPVFCIEVKGPKGTVSSVQKQVHDMLRQRNVPVCVAKSVDDVRDFLQAEGFCFNEIIFR